MIQRIALYATLGLTLDFSGAGYDTLGFWCVVSLFWALEHITHREGLETGIVMAIELPQSKIDELRKQLDRINKE